MKEYNPGPPNRVSQWLVTIAVLVVVTACVLLLVRQWTPGTSLVRSNIGNVPLDVNNEPFGITTGPDRQLWFTEDEAEKIGRITTTGQLSEFPLPTARSMPAGITTGPDGALWFTEEQGNRIGRITTSGQLREVPLPNEPQGDQ
jgi:streptogramin lyase